MTEKHELRDYDVVKDNPMPAIFLDESAGNALETYTEMIRSVAASVTIPGIADIASKHTSNLLAKSFAPTQSIISASLATSMMGPQSIMAAALDKALEGSQGIVAAALAKGLAPQRSVATALANMDSVAKLVATSESQISKNIAMMDALNASLNTKPYLPSPALPRAISVEVRVDPTPGLLRETNAVMRQILATDQQVVEANTKLLQRDIEREARNEKIERRNTRLTVLSVVLAGALFLLTVYSLLPH